MTSHGPAGCAPRRTMKAMRQRGFTLIELMIVVAIVGILASIAYPSYRDSILKGRRAEARTALLELMQQQERYMTQRGAYLQFLTAGDATAGTTFKVYSGDARANAKYLLSAKQCPAIASGGTAQPLTDCIQLLAEPQSADPVVNVLTLTSTGAKGCTGKTGTDDTMNVNSKLCWP